MPHLTSQAAQVTEGYKEYEFTDDYRCNKCGTPATTAQIDGAGGQANGSSGAEIG